MNSILTLFQLGQADKADKIHSKIFPRERGSSGSPKVFWIQSYLLAIFSGERRRYMEDVNLVDKAANMSGTECSMNLFPEETGATEIA